MKLARYCFLTATVFFTMVISSLAATGLEINLTSKQDSFLSDNAVKVSVTFTNRSKEAMKFLKWETPFEGVEDNLFSVTLDGKTVTYIGRDYKRVLPTEKDYLTLLPKESLTEEVNLADYYDFSATGNYNIKYNVATFDDNKTVGYVGGNKNAESDSTDLFIEGRKPTPRADQVAAPGFVHGSSNFSSCSEGRMTDLTEAREWALYYADDSLTYLTAGFQNPRYTEWFGSFDVNRYFSVTDHFRNIRNAVHDQPMTFDCSCSQAGVYAYVYSNSPYAVYLCNAFWTAPMIGTDSKAGTLIHEVSHFSVVAGTNDAVYGQSAARNLASNDPARASNNADNHEYFAEASTSRFDSCANEPGNCGVAYRSHVAYNGWLNTVSDGEVSGTTGEGRQMEAVQINLHNVRAGVGVQYRAHVGFVGWQGWVQNGATAGTTGQGLRMEAVEIRLTNAPSSCHIYYRAHVAGIGWQNWVMDGATAGTTGDSRQMEALRVFVSCP